MCTGEQDRECFPSLHHDQLLGRLLSTNTTLHAQAVAGPPLSASATCCALAGMLGKDVFLIFAANSTRQGKVGTALSSHIQSYVEVLAGKELRVLKAG